MAHLIDKDALVAEIERRTKAYQENFDKADNKIAKLFADGLIQGLESFLAFLDTFEVKEVKEEPVSKDLEEAANTYVDNWYKLNNLDKESYPIDVEISKNDFKAGAKWHKELMEKEVDLEGISKNYALNNSPWDDCMLEMQNAFKDGFELGLKVQKGG